MMIEGLLFGMVDNGVLAYCAVKGIDLDSKFNYGKVNGALYGALFGNALSDCMGAMLDPSMDLGVMINITIGCLIVVPVVKVYMLIKNKVKEWDDG